MLLRSTNFWNNDIFRQDGLLVVTNYHVLHKEALDAANDAIGAVFSQTSTDGTPALGFDVIWADEGHHVAAKSYQDILNFYGKPHNVPPPTVYRAVTSVTFQRADGLSISDYVMNTLIK